MLRAVYYCRVSTEEEKQVNALQKQISECEHEIKAHKWKLVDSFIDEGKSGTTVKGRKEYQRLLEAMDTDSFDVLVIKSQDRLQRSPKDWYIFIDKLVSNDKKLFIYLEGGFYTPDNSLITGIKAILAEEYSKDLSKKLNNSNQRRIQKAKEGKEVSVMGTNLTYGYYIKDKQWVIDTEQAKIVKLCYELYLEYDSIRKVTRKLNEMGYKNQHGDCFNEDSISRIIKNERNKGLVVIGRWHRDFNTKKVRKTPPETWAYAKCEPIVSEEVWDKANNRIKSKINNNGRGRNVSRDNLGGKLYCANCGAVLYRHMSIQGKKKYYNWYCSSCYNHGGIGTCDNPQKTTTIKVYKALSVMADRLKPNKRAIKSSLVEWLDTLKASLMVDDNKDIEDSIKKLQTKKDRLLDIYSDGIITKQAFTDKVTKISEELDSKRALLKPIEENPDIQSIESVLANIDTEIDNWIATEDFEQEKSKFLLEHIEDIQVSEIKETPVYDIGVDKFLGALFTGKDFSLYVRDSM